MIPDPIPLDFKPSKAQIDELVEMSKQIITAMILQDLKGVYMTNIDNMYRQVEEFNNKVIGIHAPEEPTMLYRDRQEFALTALNEEVGELKEAFADGDISAAADALVDLIYFALGRLMEMGVPVQNIWDDVHFKNMMKRKGDKGRGTATDAIKPEGWVSPDHKWITAIPKPFQEAAAVRQRKGEDYRSGDIKMSDYFPFKRLSYFTMINTKNLRLKSLLTTEKEPKHESIRDTLVDMLNYCCFAIEAIDENMF